MALCSPHVNSLRAIDHEFRAYLKMQNFPNDCFKNLSSFVIAQGFFIIVYTLHNLYTSYSIFFDNIYIQAIDNL